MVEGLAVKGDKKAAAEQIKALYKCFTDSDCTMVEVCTDHWEAGNMQIWLLL